MRVLVVGAGGFLGRHLMAALQAQGHAAQAARLDWREAHKPETWATLVKGMDAAIYLPGTVRDTAQGRSGWLDLLHHQAPLALAQARPPLLIHVSALCAGPSGYARSKQGGDAALLAQAQQTGQPLHIVQPSLVFGPGGITSRQLQGLTRLPVLPLPRAMQTCRLQPVRVEDLVEALVRLLNHQPQGTPLVAAGDEIDTLPAWLARRRARLGKCPARIVTVPEWLTQASARLGDHLSISSWNRQTLDLLQYDSIAPDPEQTAWMTALLGRPLRSVLEGAW